MSTAGEQDGHKSCGPCLAGLWRGDMHPDIAKANVDVLVDVQVAIGAGKPIGGGDDQDSARLGLKLLKHFIVDAEGHAVEVGWWWVNLVKTLSTELDDIHDTCTTDTSASETSTMKRRDGKCADADNQDLQVDVLASEPVLLYIFPWWPTAGLPVSCKLSLLILASQHHLWGSGFCKWL